MIVSRADCVYRNCTFNFDRTFFIDFVKFSGEGAGDDVHGVTKMMGDSYKIHGRDYIWPYKNQLIRIPTVFPVCEFMLITGTWQVELMKIGDECST